MNLLARTFDAEAIMEILEHPSIWENISDPGQSFTLPTTDEYHYLLGNGAVFILHPEGDDWEIHANVIPDRRDVAYEMGQEAIRYGFEVLGAKRIVASIPTEYKNVYNFALKSGLVELSLTNGVHELALEYERWDLQERKRLN